MIAARWDEATRSWQYDARRARDLFVPREQHAQAVATAQRAPAQLPSTSFGVLGDVRLCSAAPSPRRREFARGRDGRPSAAFARRARAS